jgi:hypothetical protein
MISTTTQTSSAAAGWNLEPENAAAEILARVEVSKPSVAI